MSRKQEWISRIVFYAGAVGLLWVMGRLSPTSAELEAKFDQEIGASQIVIILPPKIDHKG